MTARRLAALVAGVALVGCAVAPGTVQQRFEDSHVEVSVHLEHEGSSSVVVAEFRPFAGDLHLYGTDLPLAGIDGAGRPTRIDVVDPGWRAVGPPLPSVAESSVTLSGFSEPFPVYPDGPVTLRQPIEPTGTDDDGRIDVALTFMACSSSGLCYLPVEGVRISIGSG